MGEESLRATSSYRRKENEYSLPRLALSEQNVQSLQQKSQVETIHTGAVGVKENFSVVGKVAYELALPPSLAGVHPIFHVSMLQRNHGDLSHMLDFSSVQLDKDQSYVEEPVKYWTGRLES
ncbi:uncharacterized protein [Nicotiana sylvestris]|uniref:uncharacterized protein n=1 Tax=Nicotiana sylvestris TaxID=4096 RepID=UPI00388C409F